MEAALAVAKDIVAANRQTHDGLSAELEEKERLEGQALRRWLSQVSPHSISPTTSLGVHLIFGESKLGRLRTITTLLALAGQPHRLAAPLSCHSGMQAL